MVLIETAGTAERESHPVHRDRIPVSNLLQRTPRSPTTHVVLGVDLEPGNGGVRGHHVIDMPSAEPDAHASRRGQPRPVDRHARSPAVRRMSAAHALLGWRLPSTIFSQVPLGTYSQASPCLSRLDVPAQEEFAVWQSFLPARASP